MTKESWLLGPPGTGKTTTLSRRIQQAIHRHGSDGVLVSSFAKAAAVELAGKKLDVDRDRVGTLHSLCFRALGSPEIAEAHVGEFNEENAGFELTSTGYAGDDDEPRYSAQADGFFSFYQVSRMRMLDRPEMMLAYGQQVHWDVDRFGEFVDAWEDWKKQHEFMDFSDLLEHALHDMDRPPFEAAVMFVDEAQDCGPLTMSLARKWAARMDELHLSFDDEQAIFEWMGADPRRIFGTLPPDIEVLSQSYRVPRAVHAAADTWRRELSWRLEKEYQPRDADGWTDTDWSIDYDDPSRLLPRIEGWLDEGKSIMILGTCGYILKPTATMLKEAGVPFGNAFKPLRADWNPLDPGSAKRSSPAARVRAFLRPSTPVFGQSARMWDTDDFKAWAPHIKTELFVRGAKTAIESKDFTLPAMPQDRIDYISSLLANPMSFLPAWSGNLKWLDDNLQGATGERMRYPITVVQKRGYQEMLRPRVTVGTVHSVKGGQADVVVLYPDLSRQGYAEWTSPDLARRDSVRRLMYVAMTRAREGVLVAGNAGPAYVNLTSVL